MAFFFFFFQGYYSVKRYIAAQGRWCSYFAKALHLQGHMDVLVDACSAEFYVMLLWIWR